MTLDAPSFLWLLPAAVVMLILLQLIRSRRREVLAGSLMLWRRVAAKEKTPSRRLIVLDRSFWLQAGALCALTLALAGPALSRSSAPGRRVLFLLDNAPAARARLPDGSRAWDEIAGAARAALAELDAADRVALMVSSPFPKRLDPTGGFAPGAALAALNKVIPALSAPGAAEAWSAALDAARGHGGAGGPAATVAFSVRSAPAGQAQGGAALWRTAGPGGKLDNVALTACGSERTGTAGGAELLVQVRNFSDSQEEGEVSVESADPAVSFRTAQPFVLPPGAVRGHAFRAPSGAPAPLRIAWKRARGTDALPEDDAIVAWPQRSAAPTVRVHGRAPRLEHFYRFAEKAEIQDSGSTCTVDLEVYVEETPEAPPPLARALLFLAPRQSWGAFEAQPEALVRPRQFLAESDALTAGILEHLTGLGFNIAEARALKAVGGLKPLLRDAEGRLLAGRFRLRDGRPGFVLGYVPGEGSGWAAEMKFENDAEKFFLLRMLREAAGNLPPYAVTTAREREHTTGEALPLDWRPEAGGAPGVVCTGVLDPAASALELGPASRAPLDLSALLPRGAPVREPLWRPLALLALVLMAAEAWCARGRSAAAVVSVHLPRAGGEGVQHQRQGGHA